MLARLLRRFKVERKKKARAEGTRAHERYSDRPVLIEQLGQLEDGRQDERAEDYGCCHWNLRGSSVLNGVPGNPECSHDLSPQTAWYWHSVVCESVTRRSC